MGDDIKNKLLAIPNFVHYLIEKQTDWAEFAWIRYACRREAADWMGSSSLLFLLERKGGNEWMAFVSKIEGGREKERRKAKEEEKSSEFEQITGRRTGGHISYHLSRTVQPVYTHSIAMLKIAARRTQIRRRTFGLALWPSASGTFPPIVLPSEPLPRKVY